MPAIGLCRPSRDAENRSSDADFGRSSQRRTLGARLLHSARVDEALALGARDAERLERPLTRWRDS